MSAAAASAKLGPSAGSKLVAPRASRADRVAKAEEFKQQGRAHYQAGRYREAATAYQNATEQDPSDAGAFAGLAASRLAANDANAAIAAYSRAVRLQPASSGFHAALGRAYLASGDRSRARAAYEKALELNPSNGAAKTALEQLR
jgi:Flp pilus assembly protein TadD